LAVPGTPVGALTPFAPEVNTFSIGVSYRSILTVLSIIDIYPRCESSGTISTSFKVSTPNSGLAITVGAITPVPLF
jgi:hypothetical protein